MDTGFDLPAAVVTQDNAPGVLDRVVRVIRQQEPGLAARTRARHHHPQGMVRDIGQCDRELNNAGFAFTAAFAVVDHTVIYPSFSMADIRSFAVLPIHLGGHTLFHLPIPLCPHPCLDHLPSPTLGMQQFADPLRSRWRSIHTQQLPSQLAQQQTLIAMTMHHDQN